MSNTCDLPENQLLTWADGEAGRHTARVQAHVAGCPHCAQRLDAWTRTQRRLGSLLDRAVQDVEPLVALRVVRQHIAAHQQRGRWGIFTRFWRDAWTYNRRGALLGGALAAAGAVAGVGALIAPGLLPWQARHALAHRGVQVESMQVADGAHPVVRESETGNATLIWVEPSPPSPATGDSPAPP